MAYCCTSSKIWVSLVVVCLPRPMEGMGRLQFSDFFPTELPVPPQAAGVIGTFNVLDIYPSEHYGLSFFWTLRMSFFYKVTFFLHITGNLGIWFFQFQTNQTHYGGISKDSPVLSGGPQGTVLGPLLFLIMISDINKGTASSKLISFAHDTRVYSNIAQADYCDNLQSDLNSIYN